MLPKYHTLLSLVFIAFLYFSFPSISLFGLAIIFLSSIFIDVDHVFYYFIKKRNLNPLRAYNWYMRRRIQFHQLSREQKKKVYSGFYFFHGIEWLIILFTLGLFVNNFFLFIFIGFSFHFVADTIHEIYDKGTIDKSSLIWNYFRFRKLNASRAI